MATETVNQRRDDDTEDRANEAAALGDLVLWVSQARDLLDEIRNAAGYEGSSLAVALKRFDIRYHSADWTGGDAGDGLAYVLHRQNYLIKSLA
ncbi:MAG: hypothetical protein ACK4OE_23400 [Acidovorax sp.]|uniref:hypothetical protein n=1 Tax=Acidovorax sp. TaxID=1872122 RepID=UPI00391C11CD